MINVTLGYSVCGQYSDRHMKVFSVYSFIMNNVWYFPKCSRVCVVLQDTGWCLGVDLMQTGYSFLFLTQRPKRLALHKIHFGILSLAKYTVP